MSAQHSSCELGARGKSPAPRELHLMMIRPTQVGCRIVAAAEYVHLRCATEATQQCEPWLQLLLECTGARRPPAAGTWIDAQRQRRGAAAGVLHGES